jgi:hypothetical protein
MRIRPHLEARYRKVLSHRGLNNTFLVLVAIACLVYLLWEPVKEYLLAWMRWHLWGYPA